jgi:hypothetical protein
MLAAGTAGVVAASVFKGLLFGAGFLMGALLSALSFWRWMKVVESLGTSPERRSTTRWVIRFIVLAAAAYVIVNFLEVTPGAVFLGLLVSAASVIIAILYELTYARK